MGVTYRYLLYNNLNNLLGMISTIFQEVLKTTMFISEKLTEREKYKLYI